MLISTPLVVYALINHWSLGAVVAIFLFQNIIDCMDGAVARACDKKSKIGAHLDSAGDILFVIAFALSLIYLQTYKPTSWKTIAITLLAILTIIVQTISILDVHREDYVSNAFIDIIHDNLTIKNILMGAVVWWLANKA